LLLERGRQDRNKYFETSACSQDDQQNWDQSAKHRHLVFKLVWRLSN